LALAISTTAPSASFEASHASGHLKSSALREDSLAAARHVAERLGCGARGEAREEASVGARHASVIRETFGGRRRHDRGEETHLRDGDADGRADSEESGGGGHDRGRATVRS
jgi:hypothetical protein